MRKIFRAKTTVKSWSGMTLLIMLFHITAIQMAVGQNEPVEVIYYKDEKKVIIRNNSSKKIIAYSDHTTPWGNHVTKGNIQLSNFGIKTDRRGKKEYKTDPNGGETTIENVTNCTIFNYYTLNKKNEVEQIHPNKVENIKNEVEVTYYKDENKVIIINNRSLPIIAYSTSTERKNLHADGYETSVTLSNFGIEIAGRASQKSYEIAPKGGKITIQNVEKCTEFRYYIQNEIQIEGKIIKKIEGKNNNPNNPFIVKNIKTPSQKKIEQVQSQEATSAQPQVQPQAQAQPPSTPDAQKGKQARIIRSFPEKLKTDYNAGDEFHAVYKYEGRSEVCGQEPSINMPKEISFNYNSSTQEITISGKFPENSQKRRYSYKLCVTGDDNSKDSLEFKITVNPKQQVSGSFTGAQEYLSLPPDYTEQYRKEVEKIKEQVDKLVKESKDIDKLIDELIKQRETADKLEENIKDAIFDWDVIDKKNLKLQKDTINATILLYEEIKGDVIKVKVAIDLAIAKANAAISEKELEELEELERVGDSIVNKFKIIKDQIYKAKIDDQIDYQKIRSLTGWIGKGKIEEQLDYFENEYKSIEERAKKFQEKWDKYPVAKELMKGVEDISREIEKVKEYKKDLESIKPPVAALTIIGVLVLLAVIGLIYYWPKKQPKPEETPTSNSGVTIKPQLQKETFQDNDLSLSDIRKEAGINYYKIDMLSILEDTTIRNVYFSRECILDTYTFFSEFLKFNKSVNETGCYLIGRWEYVEGSNRQLYNISIEKLIRPGDDAVFGEYNMSFGAKIMMELDEATVDLREKTKKEYVHIAWMHSHPDLKLFLSDPDINVQSQLANRGSSKYQGRMLAIVADTLTSTDIPIGLFAPKQDGTMNRDTKDLKQTLPLRTLYKWAKTPPKVNAADTFHDEQKTQINKKDYCNIPLLSETGKINEILFSGSAIIDMDRAIKYDTTGLQGYFYGTNLEKEIVIDDFKEREEGTPLGCLLVVPHFSHQKIVADYLTDINRFDCSVIYCTGDDKIYLLTKEEYTNTVAQVTSVFLEGDMLEWTTRKR